MQIDHRILLGLIGASFLCVLADMRPNARLLALRDNFRTVTYGRFEADDFVVKKQ